MNIVKVSVGDKLLYDSFGGLIPVKVIEITNDEVLVVVTALKNNTYKRGSEIRVKRSLNRLVSPDYVKNRTGKIKILPHQLEYIPSDNP